MTNSERASKMSSARCLMHFILSNLAHDKYTESSVAWFADLTAILDEIKNDYLDVMHLTPKDLEQKPVEDAFTHDFRVDSW